MSLNSSVHGADFHDASDSFPSISSGAVALPATYPFGCGLLAFPDAHWKEIAMARATIKKGGFMVFSVSI